MISTRKSCRLCGRRDLREILEFGLTPLANSYLTYDSLHAPEPRFPLTLAFCPNCSLVQLRETVAPKALFRDYLYFSSFSKTTVDHCRELAKHLVRQYDLGKRSLVVEVASNDGYLLRHFKEEGVPVLGVEPAANIAAVARANGIPTICDFFNEDLAKKLVNQGFAPDVVIANNVIAHVPNINGFVRGLKEIVKDGGVVVVEIPYLRDIIEKAEFDMVYHEHLCYYSVKALERLFGANGLQVLRVEHLPIQGGSIRITATKRIGSTVADGSLQRFLSSEERAGLYKFDTYLDFRRRVERVKNNLHLLLAKLKAEGGTIAAYGAAAKATTFLHYLGIGSETIDFVVDRNIYKQGRFMPGNHIPIYDPSALVDRMPTYTLILAWNFSNEVLRQESEYRRSGGKFIIPMPRVIIA